MNPTTKRVAMTEPKQKIVSKLSAGFRKIVTGGSLYYSNSYSDKTGGVRIFEEAKQAAWRIAGNCTVYPEGYAIRDPWGPSKPAGKQ
jgi:hypothetical protein